MQCSAVQCSAHGYLGFRYTTPDLKVIASMFFPSWQSMNQSPRVAFLLRSWGSRVVADLNRRLRSEALLNY
jgi:hypothetical protein